MTEPEDDRERPSREASPTAQAGARANAKPHPRGGAHSAPKRSKRPRTTHARKPAPASKPRPEASRARPKTPSGIRNASAKGFVLGLPAAVVAIVALVIVWAVGPSPAVAIVLAVLAIALGVTGIVLVDKTREAASIAAQVVCAAAVLVSAVAVTASFAILTATGAGEEGTWSLTVRELNMEKAGDEALESVLDPDDESRGEMAWEIAVILEGTGFSLEDMGLTTDELSSWLSEGTSYELVDMEVDRKNGTATLTYDVTANKVDELCEAVDEQVGEMDHDEATSMDAAREKIGEAVNREMEESVPTQAEVELVLTRDDGSWEVDETDAKVLSHEVFGY